VSGFDVICVLVWLLLCGAATWYAHSLRASPWLQGSTFPLMGVLAVLVGWPLALVQLIRLGVGIARRRGTLTALVRALVMLLLLVGSLLVTVPGQMLLDRAREDLLQAAITAGLREDCQELWRTVAATGGPDEVELLDHEVRFPESVRLLSAYRITFLREGRMVLHLGGRPQATTITVLCRDVPPPRDGRSLAEGVYLNVVDSD
jgi:hypothetical protein